MATRLRAGTSGFSYKEWKGPFYPEKLAEKDLLAFYASKLPAVEINNTFYRLPRASVLEAWAAQVPEDFRFSIKASRRITHIRRLKEAQDETEYLLRTLAALGSRLGAILFQLPPNLKLDLDRLRAFLDLLPAGTPAAFEFRHESWSDPRVHEALRARDFAWVVADGVEERDEADAAPPAAAPAEIPGTASFGYLRLRRPDYQRADLAGWAQRILARGWREALVFFKHEDEGAGPRLAAQFLELAARAEERIPAQPARAPAPPRRRAAESE
jgi:uncharacterized protein YecE (DUF72 family)